MLHTTEIMTVTKEAQMRAVESSLDSSRISALTHFHRPKLVDSVNHRKGPEPTDTKPISIKRTSKHTPLFSLTSRRQYTQCKRRRGSLSHHLATTDSISLEAMRQKCYIKQ
jgi:hypothetical protein